MTDIKKPSVVLWKDQKEIVDALTDAQAGRLLKAFYSFLNNEDPKLDAVIRLVYIPFKQQFKRDDFKYQKIVERNRKNIAKRWNNNTKNTTGKSGIPDDTKNTDKGKRIKDKYYKTNNTQDKKTELKLSGEQVTKIFDELSKL